MYANPSQQAVTKHLEGKAKYQQMIPNQDPYQVIVPQKFPQHMIPQDQAAQIPIYPPKMEAPIPYNVKQPHQVAEIKKESLV